MKREIMTKAFNDAYILYRHDNDLFDTISNCYTNALENDSQLSPYGVGFLAATFNISLDQGRISQLDYKQLHELLGQVTPEISENHVSELNIDSSKSIELKTKSRGL